MAWGTGQPPSHIPEAIKRTVRQRQDNRCNTIDLTVCTGHIDEYDHIINIKSQGIARSEANSPDLLQGLCVPCHKVKTQAEALAGRNRGKRPPPKHPSDA